MSYRDWTINGLTPSFIRSDGVDWGSFPKITLHCTAFSDEDEGGTTDARDEIETFNEFACNTINNVELMNGGTDLQISPDGQIVEITEGDRTWNGAIHYIQYNEKDAVASIDWDIVIEVQIENNPASNVYTPDLRVYPNIAYDPYTGNQTGGTVSALPTIVSESVFMGNSTNFNDILNITTSHGTIQKTTANKGAPIEITSILVAGSNSISGSVVNGTGSMQCDPLLIQDETGRTVKFFDGFYYASATNGQTVNISAVSFTWDGISRVFVREGSLYVDDILTATTSKGSVSAYFNTNTTPTLDITSTLNSGANSVTVTIKNQNEIGHVGLCPIGIIDSNGSYTFISPGVEIKRAAANQSKTLGTFSYTWDGSSKVYIVWGKYLTWSNPSYIKTTDAINAICYNNTAYSCSSNWIRGSGFGFAMGSTMLVKRVQVKVVYANSSVTANSKNAYLKLKGPGMELTASKAFKHGTNPASMQTLVFDTVNGDFSGFSSDVDVYNDASFEAAFRCEMDAFRNLWVDSIDVNIWYEPPETVADDEIGSKIGEMTIVEGREVKQVEVTGCAANIPSSGAWLDINGNKQDWHVSGDNDTGNTGTNGIETLSFTISPPSSVLSFITSDSFPRLASGNTAEDNSGSLIQQIKVYYT